MVLPYDHIRFRPFIMTLAMLPNLWYAHPGLVAVAAAVVAFVALFLARPRVHRLILSLGQGAAWPFQRARVALVRLARGMRERNRTVLLAQARRETGAFLEKEFRSVDESVRRDLGGFPELNRVLLERAAIIEASHHQGSELPPPPAEWGRIMSVLTLTQPPGETATQRRWRRVRRDAARAQSRALAHYRKASEERQRLLASLRPSLDALRGTLADVDRHLVLLRERAVAIDQYMHRYLAIAARKDATEKELVSSVLVQFLTATALTALAAAGYLAQVWLLAASFAPASSTVATGLAFGLVVAGALAGFVMTEAFGFSSLVLLFDDAAPAVRRKIGLTAAAAGVLLMLAEVAGALWDPGSTSGLRGWGREELALCIALLPIALAFSAIPLESLIYGARILLGRVLETVVRLLATLCGGIARLCRHAALAGIVLYDALIVVPLAVSAWRRRNVPVGDAASRAPDVQVVDR
ncbi:MAG: hypothetical protein ACYCQK_10000 [Acidiferrobacteraceae bacterium]